MPNLTSALIIAVALLIGVKTGASSNPLLSFGILIMSSYLAVLFVRRIKLPAYYGYIAVGVIAGSGGLGIFHESFAQSLVLIESLAVMVYLSMIVRSLCFAINGKQFGRLVFTGILSSIAVSALMLGFLAPVALQFKSKVILSLFTGIFAPFIVYESESSDKKASNTVVALGGFAASIIIWGFAVAVLEPGMPHRARIAFMPVISTLTSLLFGFVWAYVADKLLFHRMKINTKLFPLLIHAMIYPCLGELGLDFIFISIGTGLYFGLFAEREYFEKSYSDILPLIVFGLFATRIPLFHESLVSSEIWHLILIITLCSMFIKTLIPFLLLKAGMIKTDKKQISLSLAMYGPLSLLLLNRFLPGFRLEVDGIAGSSEIPVICLMSALTVLMFSSLVYFVRHLKSKIITNNSDISPPSDHK